MRVLIAGGGIGGLTLALMLHKRGIKATIYEQASSVREIGVGINTLPHAIKELADLDLLDVLDRTGIRRLLFDVVGEQRQRFLPPVDRRVVGKAPVPGLDRVGDELGRCGVVVELSLRSTHTRIEFGQLRPLVFEQGVRAEVNDRVPLEPARFDEGFARPTADPSDRVGAEMLHERIRLASGQRQRTQRVVHPERTNLETRRIGEHHTGIRGQTRNGLHAQPQADRR